MSDPGHPRLSAVIIARNEALDLPACLGTLGFCDEIVVVENASSDGTAAIAAAAGARVLTTADFPGFGLQKQRALELATGEWILSIDADERIPPELAEEIRATIAAAAADGYRIDRTNHFLGYVLKHGGWSPDRVLRLARRSKASFTPDVIHESLKVDGTVADLVGAMDHLSYRNIQDVLDKQRRYALASANVRRQRGKKGGLLSAFGHSGFTFFKHYFLQAGFLDGPPGLVAAASKAQETFWRYLAVGWER